MSEVWISATVPKVLVPQTLVCCLKAVVQKVQENGYLRSFVSWELELRIN